VPCVRFPPVSPFEMHKRNLSEGLLLMKMKKWKDLAVHRAGCPYKGVAVHGSEEEMTKYYSGNCPGYNVPVKWEEEKQEKNPSTAS